MSTQKVALAINKALESARPTDGRRYAQVVVSKPFMTTSRVVLTLTSANAPSDLITVHETALGGLLLVQGATQYLLAASEWSSLRLTEYEET